MSFPPARLKDAEEISIKTATIADSRIFFITSPSPRLLISHHVLLQPGQFQEPQPSHILTHPLLCPTCALLCPSYVLLCPACFLLYPAGSLPCLIADLRHRSVHQPARTFYPCQP